MTIDMVMPQMGESLSEGTIVKWHKKVGEYVEKDDIILEISTDKVDSEIPASDSGKIVEILANEGDTVEVGTTIAKIATKDSQQEEKTEDTTKEKAVEDKASKGTLKDQLKSDKETKRFYSPVVKKIAKEHDIPPDELETISGSGANGRVTKEDILAFIDSREPTAETKESASKTEKDKPQPPVAKETQPTEDTDRVSVIEMDHVRKKIAQHMIKSKQTAAHVTTVAECDVSKIVNFRESKKDEFLKREGVKLTYTAFFVMVISKALKEFPLMNSSIDNDKIVQKKYINIGVAVGLDKGLIVPVIRNVDQLNLNGIARQLSDLSNRARNKKLQPEQVQDGTFSITNIGTYGNLWGTPIINQPQVAILGTGAIKKRPVVLDDMIAIRSMMYLSLTYDHRIIDGLYAGSFLQKVVQLLENFDS
jgi:2-oxoglutarate dehydrogenase E2 component (dihydrolipoamide succinyltransferase)